MRMNFRRGAQTLLLAVCATLASSSLVFAATPLVWEAEAATNLSGKAFKVMKLAQDPSGQVSGKKILGIDKIEKGQPIPKDSVAYKIKIPADGTYYLWVRVRWSDGCGNSIMASISGVKADWKITGPTYGSMQWLTPMDAKNPLALRLKKGTTTVTIKSSESGIMMDQLLLIADKKYKPASIYTPTKDLLQ